MTKIIRLISFSIVVIVLAACSSVTLENEVEILKENGWRNFLFSEEEGITIIEPNDNEEFLDSIFRFIAVAKGDNIFSLELASIFEFETNNDAINYYNEQLKDLDVDDSIFIRGKLVYNYIGNDPESFQQMLNLKD
jgi:hypothetical protein